MAEQETVKVAADLVEVIDKAVAEHFKGFKEENAQQLEELAEAAAIKAFNKAAKLANVELVKLQELCEKASTAAEEVKLLKKELKAKKVKISEDLDATEQEAVDQLDAATEQHLQALKGAAEGKLAELAGVKELATDGVVTALKAELVAESPDLDRCRLLVDALSEKVADKEGSKQLIFRLHRQLDVLEVKMAKGEPADFKDVLPALLNFNTFLKTGIASELIKKSVAAKIDKPVAPERLTKEQQKQQVRRANEIFRLEHHIKETKEQLANYKEDPNYPNRKERLQRDLEYDEARLAELKGQTQHTVVKREAAEDEDSFTIENEG